jgi:beta-galactosidase
MRTVIPFNSDWTFLRGNVGFSAAETEKGEEISLPHTWNGTDGQDGGGDYYRGTCFYVKRFRRPAMAEGEKLFVEFQGVNDCAEVTLNRQKIVSHFGGYSAFRGELTPALQEDNLLIVRVSNEPRPDIYPQKADFTFYGGIYRDVRLILVPALHFDLLSFGGIGIQADALLEGKDGICRIRASSVSGGEIRIRLEDEEHHPVASGVLGEELRIQDVHRWNGIEDPYLYTVIATLFQDGILQDEVRTEIGFRTFRIDPKKGFFLNEKPYPLRGVSRHQDRPLKGNAISRQDEEEDRTLLREIGANAVRLAHYQQDDFFYSLCDHEGLIVWSEIPYLSEHREEADANAIQQMKELIVQTYHHPSIVFRCLSNEITMKKAGKDRLKEHQRLADLVRQEDPTRLSVIACYASCSDFNRLNFIPDALAFNFYFGWYFPGTFLTALRLDLFHFLFPSHPVGLSEYGAEGMTTLHSRSPKRLDESEEYQAEYHEKLLKIIVKRKYLWGTFAWNLCDFGSDSRNEGGDPGKNHKGLVTFDRKTKKDAFYLYQAYWTERPFLHLCSKRFAYRTGKKTVIKVYTNQKEVTLSINGKKAETRKGEKVFSFRVPLLDRMDIKVNAGGLKDGMTVFKVSKPEPSYRCRESDPYSWEKRRRK